MSKELLMSSSYWVLNKKLVKKIGIEASFLLTNLLEAEKMMGNKDGWFFQTIETLEEISTLSRHKQNIAIEKLESLDVIEVDVRGIPAKRYFKINEKSLLNVLTGGRLQYVNNSQTRMSESDKLECKKSATNKESNYKENNYKSSSSEDQNSFKFYSENIGMITPFVAEDIGYWIDTLSDELVIEAMKRSLLANKRNFNYAKGILKNWHDNNVKTIEDVDSLESEFKNKQGNRKKKEVDISEFDLND